LTGIGDYRSVLSVVIVRPCFLEGGDTVGELFQFGGKIFEAGAEARVGFRVLIASAIADCAFQI
jgi:hypothetical protein